MFTIKKKGEYVQIREITLSPFFEKLLPRFGKRIFSEVSSYSRALTPHAVLLFDNTTDDKLKLAQNLNFDLSVMEVG